MVLAGSVNEHEPGYHDWKMINSATYGVVFLGTPHHGSAFAKLGLLQAWFQRAMGAEVYDEQLRALQLDSTNEALPDLRDDFERLRKSKDLLGLELFCFFETKPVPGLGVCQYHLN